MGKKVRGINAKIRAMALSQISILLIEIFAFCFLFSFSFAGVSAASAPTITPAGYVDGTMRKKGDSYVALVQDSSAGNSYSVRYFNSNNPGASWTTGELIDLTPKAYDDAFLDYNNYEIYNPDSTPTPIQPPSSSATWYDEGYYTDNGKYYGPSGELTKTEFEKQLKDINIGGFYSYSGKNPPGDVNTPTPKAPQITDTVKTLTSQESISEWSKLQPDNIKKLEAAGWDENSWNNYIKQGDVSYTNPFSKKDFTPQTATGHFLGNAFEGLQYASVVLGYGLAIAQIFPGEKANNVKSITLALSAGIMAGKTTYGIISAFNKFTTPKGAVGGQGGQVGAWGTGISVGVGLLVAYYILAKTFKKTETTEVTIQFKCMPWQAPSYFDSNTRKDQCNKCNENPLMPCSEYRCKSLGQTCKIINQGTGNEKCIDGSPYDVNSPGIKPWNEAITEGYQYTGSKMTRPPGQSSGPSGMRIVNPERQDGCLKAFTAFTFGILTTEEGDKLQPSQCKIDFNHTKSYNDLQYYMGDSNMFNENHSQSISLPGTSAINTSFPGVENNGEYSLYIRCKDGNENVNQDEYVVNFCIESGPDQTAPLIKATSIASNSPVLYKVDNLSLEVYTNEPSNCRWSRSDSDYDAMENQMNCDNAIWQMNAELMYTCHATLTGIKDKEENQFYFRCKDMNNISMQQSYPFKLIGTQPLTILEVGPNGTIGGGTNTITTTLAVKTDNGYSNGNANCQFSTNPDSGFVEMSETGGNLHTQNLDLTQGNYNYYFKCFDLGGNTAFNSTNFSIFTDRSAPTVVRVYSLESQLIIGVDEDSSCYYSTSSCNFDIAKSEGTEMPYSNQTLHTTAWKTNQNYYIKCVDRYGNQPNPSECSIIIRPYSISSS